MRCEYIFVLAGSSCDMSDVPWVKIFCFNDSYKFKALELNKKIIEGAEALKKPPVKDPTVPEGFELQIEKRLQKRQTSKPQDEEKPHNFKSHPLPKKILEGVVVSLDSGLQGYIQVSFFSMCDCPMFCGAPGFAREEGAASNGPRVSSFCPQEEGSQGTGSWRSKDTFVVLMLAYGWLYMI